MKFIQMFISFIIISFFIFSNTSVFIIGANDNINYNFNLNRNSIFMEQGSSFTWEDDFLDESKIDSQISYNYEFNGYIYKKH